MAQHHGAPDDRPDASPDLDDEHGPAPDHVDVDNDDLAPAAVDLDDQPRRIVR